MKSNSSGLLKRTAIRGVRFAGSSVTITNTLFTGAFSMNGNDWQQKGNLEKTRVYLTIVCFIFVNSFAISPDMSYTSVLLVSP